MPNFGRMLMLLAVGVAATVVLSAQSEHYNVNGDFAYTSWSDGNQGLYLQVYSNKQANITTNHIAVIVYYGPSYIVSADGTIPKDAFTGNVASGMTLNLDMASFQGNFESCDYSDPTFPVCGAMTKSGTIQAQWTRTNQSSSTSKHVLTSKYPTLQEKIVGTSDEYSAVSSGTALGVSFPKTYAIIGMAHNITIDIQKVK